MAVRCERVEVGPGEQVPVARAVELVRDEPLDPGDPRDPVDEVVVCPAIERPARLPESHFFDPHDPAAEPRIVLERRFADGKEAFRLGQAIGYWDEEVGTVIVPYNLARFETDLTSVFRFFTWLVARTGVHLPAALVHDALTPDSGARTADPDAPALDPCADTADPGAPTADRAPDTAAVPDAPTPDPSVETADRDVSTPDRKVGATYVASRTIDRETADRMFRDGMGRLGTSLLQRWLIWSAVATATMVTEPRRAAWRAWLALCVTVGAVLVLGTMATIDLVDCRAWLPWMGDRQLWDEVVWGAVCAVLIPVALSVLWGRRWRAGAIIGVALALLVHVTVAIALVYAVFAALDAAGERRLLLAAQWAGAALGGAAAIVVVAMVAC